MDVLQIEITIAKLFLWRKEYKVFNVIEVLKIYYWWKARMLL